MSPTEDSFKTTSCCGIKICSTCEVRLVDSPCIQCRTEPVSFEHNRALNDVVNMIKEAIKSDGRDIENLQYGWRPSMEVEHDKQYRDDKCVFTKKMKGLSKMIDRMSHVLNYARTVRTITTKELIGSEIKGYTVNQGIDYGKNEAILYGCETKQAAVEKNATLKYFDVSPGQFLKDNVLANIPEFSQEVISVAFVASNRLARGPCVCRAMFCGCGHDTYVNLCKHCHDTAEKWCRDFQDAKKLGPEEFLRKEQVDTLPHAPSGSPDKFDKGQLQFLKYCCHIHVLGQAICLDRQDFPELRRIITILRQHGAVGEVATVLESLRNMASEGLEIGRREALNANVVVDDDVLIQLPEIRPPKRKRPRVEHITSQQRDTT